MAEIKSTLDIIMEKAKGITVTEEEKAQFKRRELQTKVEGFFHKTLGGAMDLERLATQLAGIDHADRGIAMEFLLQQCLARLDLEGGNKPVMVIMEELLKVDTSPLKAILETFREELEKGRRDQEEKIKKDLGKAGISGSAVVPNILAAPDWNRYVSELREKFSVELESIRDELMNI
jgi:hypothetical protein